MTRKQRLLAAILCCIFAPLLMGAALQKPTFQVTLSYTPATSSSFTFGNGSVTGHTAGDSIVIIPDKDANGNPITKVENWTISGDSYITTLIIPATVTQLEWFSIWNCPNLKTIICYGTTPPSWQSYLGWQLDSSTKIYVPDDSVSAYKSSWSKYKNQIYKLSTYSG